MVWITGFEPIPHAPKARMLLLTPYPDVEEDFTSSERKYSMIVHLCTGGLSVTWTQDLLIKNQLLYQLS